MRYFNEIFRTRDTDECGNLKEGANFWDPFRKVTNELSGSSQEAFISFMFRPFQGYANVYLMAFIAFIFR